MNSLWSTPVTLSACEKAWALPGNPGRQGLAVLEPGLAVGAASFQLKGHWLGAAVLEFVAFPVALKKWETRKIADWSLWEGSKWLFLLTKGKHFTAISLMASHWLKMKAGCSLKKKSVLFLPYIFLYSCLSATAHKGSVVLWSRGAVLPSFSYVGWYGWPARSRWRTCLRMCKFKAGSSGSHL